MASRLAVYDRTILNTLLFINITCLFTIGQVEELSKLIITSSGVLFCFLMIRSSITRTFRFPKLALIYVALWLYACISLSWTPNVAYSLETFSELTSAYFTVIVLWMSLYYTDYKKVIAPSVIVIILIQAYFLVVTEPNPRWPDRLGGLSPNPNDTALELSMMAFLSLLFIENYLLRYGFVIISIAATMLTGTRKLIFTILGLVLISALQLFRYLTLSRRNLVIVGIVTVILSGILVVSSGNLIDSVASTSTFSRISDLFAGRYDDSAIERTELIDEAIEHWLKSPIFGNGLGSSFQLSRTGLYSHNNYLELLLSFGIVGFLLFYSFDFIVFAKLIPKARKGSVMHQYLIIYLAIILLYDLAMVSFSSRSSTLGIRVIIAFMAENYETDAAYISG